MCEGEQWLWSEVASMPFAAHTPGSTTPQQLLFFQVCFYKTSACQIGSQASTATHIHKNGLESSDIAPISPPPTLSPPHPPVTTCWGASWAPSPLLCGMWT